MRKLLNIFFLIIFTVLLIGYWEPVSAHAAEGRLLPDGMVIGDDKGLKCKPDGKFMVEINDAFPGNKWKSNITVMNMEEDSAYEITFQVLETTFLQGKIDLTKAIDMKLTYDGKVVYQGTVRGTPGTSDVHSAPISLGVFQPGQSRVLVAEFEMDHTYTEKDYVIKNIAENVWEFRAIKTLLPTTESTKKKTTTTHKKGIVNKLIGLLPQTGEDWKNAMIYISLGMSLILIVMLIIKKRMEQKAREHELPKE